MTQRAIAITFLVGLVAVASCRVFPFRYVSQKLDSDGDGFDDSWEFCAATDPLDPASYPIGGSFGTRDVAKMHVDVSFGGKVLRINKGDRDYDVRVSVTYPSRHGQWQGLCTLRALLTHAVSVP